MYVCVYVCMYVCIFVHALLLAGLCLAVVTLSIAEYVGAVCLTHVPDKSPTGQRNGMCFNLGRHVTRLNSLEPRYDLVMTP